MNNRSATWEIVVSLLLIVLLILFCNPLNLLMTPLMLMGVITCLIVCFAVFGSFIWRERARDEREVVERMAAGRIAFLTGAGILVIGIIYQSFSHAVDPWLVLTLGMMIVAKLAGILYSESK